MKKEKAIIVEKHRLNNLIAVMDETSPANPIFQMMMKERLSSDDCAAIIREVRNKHKELKLTDLLPYRWSARYVPKGNDVANVATLAELWGLKSGIKRGNNQRFVAIEQEPHTKSIVNLPIESKASRDCLVLEMLAGGHTIAETAELAGCSVSTVKRIKRGSNSVVGEDRESGAELQHDGTAKDSDTASRKR